MREMRPLLLPKIVAVRNSVPTFDHAVLQAASPTSAAAAAAAAPNALTASAALTAIYRSAGAAVRHSAPLHSSPSSSSSTSSSSSSTSSSSFFSAGMRCMTSPVSVPVSPCSSYEQASTLLAVKKKLSGVLEEEVPEPLTPPVDNRNNDDADDDDDPPLTSSGKPPSSDLFFFTPDPFDDFSYDLDSSFSSQSTLPSAAAQRRSANSSLSTVAERLGSRLKRRLDRFKTGSLTTPWPTPSVSRASSLTGMPFPFFDHHSPAVPDACAQPPAFLDSADDMDDFENVEFAEHDEDDEAEERSSADAAAAEPVNRRELASTPLLPPVIPELDESEPRVIPQPQGQRQQLLPSLLPSSSWDGCSPFVYAGNPLHALPSPPLSSKTSVSSFRQRSTGAGGSAGIGPSMEELRLPGHGLGMGLGLGLPQQDNDDEWCARLGHANFVIRPAPYVPALCDEAACSRLFDDWQLARRRYNIHQVRTGEHYGATSKTFRLTEEKWAAIEGQWRRSNELALARAAESGAVPERRARARPPEPAPLVRVPSLADAETQGKFPSLGDEGIVGPMVQGPAHEPTHGQAHGHGHGHGHGHYGHYGHHGQAHGLGHGLGHSAGPLAVPRSRLMRFVYGLRSPLSLLRG